MNIQMIPLNRLVPSPRMSARPARPWASRNSPPASPPTACCRTFRSAPARGGKFEVAAGGRRLASLKLLAKQKAIAKDAEIGCNVLDGEDGGEISFAENTIRVSMYPADQFDAFKALADTGKGPEEIAGRFGCTPAVVRQRLKLATVSPRLMGAYRAGEMDLDQMMVFTRVGRPFGAGNCLVRSDQSWPPRHPARPDRYAGRSG